MTGYYSSYWMNEPSTKFVVRYNHRGPQAAGSKYEALLMVQAEAGQPEMVKVDVPDATFCYCTQAEADADHTGAKAFATITKIN